MSVSKQSTGTEPPPLFGPETGEISERQRKAEAQQSSAIQGDRLSAEFKTPLTAQNRRVTLKPGAKPIQEEIFRVPDGPAQSGFNFLKPLDAPLNPKDHMGSIENSAFRYYPPEQDAAAATVR